MQICLIYTTSLETYFPTARTKEDAAIDRQIPTTLAYVVKHGGKYYKRLVRLVDLQVILITS